MTRHVRWEGRWVPCYGCHLTTATILDTLAAYYPRSRLCGICRERIAGALRGED